MVDVVTEFCPAKINPYLAVTGKRDDGFHELISVAAPVSVGDTLEVRAADSDFRMTCDDADLPTDGANLVIKAATVFRELSGWTGGAEFHLRKALPSGAGLGGGSSDAVGALRALNRISGGRLSPPEMQEAAARVGSDCPLFLREQPVVMRGRGEHLAGDEQLSRGLAGRELVLMKPGFGVSTVWAYAQLAQRAPHSYQTAAQAEADLATWCGRDDGALGVGFNAFWPIVAAKYPALPVLARRLREACGMQLHLSGSGSACFGWVEPETDLAAVEAIVRQSWGDGTWLARASCLPNAKS